MRFVHGLRDREIARRLNTSAAAIAMARYRMRQKSPQFNDAFPPYAKPSLIA